VRVSAPPRSVEALPQLVVLSWLVKGLDRLYAEYSVVV
jgi:hypothetical protein